MDKVDYNLHDHINEIVGGNNNEINSVITGRDNTANNY